MARSLPTSRPVRSCLPTLASAAGADSNLLYLTSGKSLYKIRVGVKGYQLP